MVTNGKMLARIVIWDRSKINRNIKTFATMVGGS